MHDLFTYPQSPGWKARETSAAAARAMRKTAPTLREKCLEALMRLGPLTADEIAEKIGSTPGAIRPRCSELALEKLIEDSNERRKNASGINAIVWVAR